MASIIQADTIANAAGTGPVNFSKGYKASNRVKELVNTNYTILDSDGYDFIYSTTTLTAQRTITLPLPANNTGRIITIQRADTGTAANNIVVSVNGGLIDGASTNQLTAQYSEITLLCDGTNWIASNVNGDIVTASQSRSTPVSLSTGSTANILSSPLSLTPGTWAIYTAVGLELGTGTTIGTTIVGTSLTSATLPNAATVMPTGSGGEVRCQVYFNNSGPSAGSLVIPVQTQFVTLTSTTSIYLVVNATFATSTLSAHGSIQAMRIR